MLSYFCSKCGGKNLYQFQKPKFCSHCGANFTIASINISNNIKSDKFEVNINTNKNTNIDYNNEYLEQPIQDYSSMQKLDVHIEKYNQNDGIKLGELVSDGATKTKTVIGKKAIKRPRGKKKVVKSLPASFISEAKMSGRNYQNYEELNILDNEE